MRLLLGFYALLFSISGFSQKSPTPQAPKTQYNLEEFIITGNKWEEKETFTHIEGISAQKIQINAPQTGADILSSSGQVFVQKSQLGGGSPMIRGMAANRILLMYNGVRMNNAIYRSGNLQSAILIDPNMIQQAEVHLGANSLLFGSDGLGGVVHYQSFKPQFSDSLSVNGKIGTQYQSAYRGSQIHGRLNISHQKWALQVNHTEFQYGDLRMGSNGHPEYRRDYFVARNESGDTLISNANPLDQVGSGYQQKNSGFTLAYALNKRITVEYELLNTSSSNIPRYDRLIEPGANGDDLKYASWYYGPQNWTLHRLQIKGISNSKLVDEYQIQGSYQDYEESRLSRKFGSNSQKVQLEKNAIYGLQIDFWKKGKLDLKYGYDIQSNHVQSKAYNRDIRNNNQSKIQTRYPTGSKWAAHGVYFTTLIPLENNFQANVGGRISYFSLQAPINNTFLSLPFDQLDISGLGWSGNASVRKTIANQFHVNALTGLAFRAPNIDDAAKVFDSEPGTVIIPNGNLTPEYAWNRELGFEWNTEHNLIKGGLFHTLLYSAMIRQADQLNGQDSILYDGQMSEVLSLQNASKATIWGVYGQIKTPIYKNLFVEVNVSYQKGLVEENGIETPMRHALPLFGNINLIYATKKLHVQTSLGGMDQVTNSKLAPSEQNKRAIYAQDVNGNPYSPAWTRWDLKGSYTLQEKYAFTFGIENIMDVAYRPYSSGIVSAGRNFILGFSLKI